MASTRSSKRNTSKSKQSQTQSRTPANGSTANGSTNEPKVFAPTPASDSGKAASLTAPKAVAPFGSRRDGENRFASHDDALPMSVRTWNILGWAIVLLAALVRLWDLDLVPFHHDEGVNGNFLMTLYRSGEYRYDPTNYHGPNLYYFALIIARLGTFLFGDSGLNDTTLRLVPAFFGIGTVWLVLCLRRYLGAWATLFAATFVALSPGMVYISRYFIHEMHFVFFTLGFVVATLRFLETNKLIWPALASASLAMVFAAKETAPISLIVLIVALLMVWGLSFVSPHLSDWMQSGQTEIDARDDERLAQKFQSDKISSETPFETSGLSSSTRNELPSGSLLSLVVTAAFVGTIVVLFTSFFTNNNGVRDFFDAYLHWRDTGKRDQGAPFSQYLWWLLAIESPLLFLSIIGIAWNLIERRNRFALFCSLWAGGLWLAYSLIPYKTPWLMINWVLPMALVAGWVVQRVAEIAWSSTRSLSSTYSAALPLFGVASLVIACQSWMLNAVHYDDDSAYQVGGNSIKKYPYVYVHTVRQINDLLRQIEHYGEVTGKGKDLTIGIYSSDYWPLPWNLRHHKAVGFYGQVGQPSNEILIIGNVNQDEQIAQVAGNNFERKGVYPLRPGVDLTLWVHRDYADK